MQSYVAGDKTVPDHVRLVKDADREIQQRCAFRTSTTPAPGERAPGQAVVAAADGQNGLEDAASRPVAAAAAQTPVPAAASAPTGPDPSPPLNVDRNADAQATAGLTREESDDGLDEDEFDLAGDAIDADLRQ